MPNEAVVKAAQMQTEGDRHSRAPVDLAGRFEALEDQVRRQANARRLCGRRRSAGVGCEHCA